MFRGYNLERTSLRNPYPTIRPPSAQRGFTLIELMVVLGIVVLISLLILVSASRFNSAILLRSLAYDVGLAVREAQLYGVAVKGVKDITGTPVSPVACPYGSPSSLFCAAYGVDFQKNVNVITVFADVGASPDGIYERGEPVVDQFKAQYGFSISNFCVSDTASYICSVADAKPAAWLGQTYTGATLSKLDITFARPNPNAVITPSFSSGTPPSTLFTQAFIVVSSPAGCQRSVLVSSTGQIVVTPTVGPIC